LSQHISGVKDPQSAEAAFIQWFLDLKKRKRFFKRAMPAVREAHSN